jgi:hypothetical protein
VLPQQADPIVNFRSSQTDTQPRARDLQRTNGHVEYLSDLFSVLSPLHEISNLLKSGVNFVGLPRLVITCGLSFASVSVDKLPKVIGEPA